MPVRLLKRWWPRAAVSATAWLSLMGPSASGQVEQVSGWKKPCPPPPVVTPCPPPSAMPLPPGVLPPITTPLPPSSTPPSTTPETPVRPPETSTPTTPTTPTTTAPTTPTPAAPPESLAGLGGRFPFAPNVIGNALLNGTRSISYFYQGAGNGVLYQATGLTSIINAKVAENNSPVPRDRVSFRYNFFDSSQEVRGIGNGPRIMDPNVGGAIGLSTVAPTTRSYDVNLFTFSGEKTFFDGLFSAEVRIPFSHTLSNNLDLSVGTFTGIDPLGNPSGGVPNSFPGLNVTNTPDQTLGQEETQFGDMSVILKALLYQTERVAVSTGMGISLPTAPNTRLRVTDYDYAVDPDVRPVDVDPLPIIQRVRLFEIENETVGLSPFIAVLLTPNDRLFVQGFLEYDFAVSRNTIRFSQRVPINVDTASYPDVPLDATDEIREQHLMQSDVGIGYWLARDPEARWLNGIAPTVELHYTTTLNQAQFRTLPTLPFVESAVGSTFVPEPAPVVGNQRNRVDILDMTVGTTFLLANQATLATAVSFPLKNGDNRTYDWELQVQLNYFFGGGGNRGGFGFGF